MISCLRFCQICLILIGSLCCSLSGKSQAPINIIFETDMGNDIDDALALDILYKYQDKGQIKLLAVNSNKDSRYSTEFIHVLNNWYGYPKIPIGKVIYGVSDVNVSKNYDEYVSQLKDENGKPVFRRSKFNYNDIPDAVKLYRKILAKQPDSSVTIVSVGFSTNIARLLRTAPDQYSPLSGKELVAKKVKLLSVMAGGFKEVDPIREYNVINDIPSAKLVAEQWPTPIVFAPWETGMEVRYPARSIVNDFYWVKHHPIVLAYKHFKEMPYDRPTWDLLSVLYAVEGSSGYFGMSPCGTVTIDEKGTTLFKADPNGNRAYLSISKEQAPVILNRFIELLSSKPGKLK